MISDTKFSLPEGREVILTVGSQNVFEVLKTSNTKLVKTPTLVYTDDLTLSINTSYKNLVATTNNTLLTLLSGAFPGVVPSGQFALQGLQIWENTEVLEFSLSVTLYMIDDARNDVVITALSLAQLCVPYKNTKENGKAGYGLIPPGPNIKDVLQLAGLTESNVDKNDNRNFANGGLLSIQIGKFMKIENIVITKVEPTFSSILDEDYNPVSCTLSIDFRTVEVVTTNMLQNMIGGL